MDNLSHAQVSASDQLWHRPSYLQSGQQLIIYLKIFFFYPIYSRGHLSIYHVGPPTKVGPPTIIYYLRYQVGFPRHRAFFHGAIRIMSGHRLIYRGDTCTYYVGTPTYLSRGHLYFIAGPPALTTLGRRLIFIIRELIFHHPKKGGFFCPLSAAAIAAAVHSVCVLSPGG